MKTIERFDLEQMWDETYQEYEGVMVSNNSYGEWVLYEDVKDAIELYNNLMEKK